MAPYDWNTIRQNIFAGESGGDYNALFGYSNRPGKQFEGTRLTDMTVDQALNFANPSGPYGQWVKGQVGRVATPMGAYQVVGTTLREAKRALGLRGDEKMTPELQERIGRWVYETQGTGAWEGYKADAGARSVAADTMQALGKGKTMTPMVPMAPEQERPKGMLGLLSNPDVLDALAMGFAGMTLYPNEGVISSAASRMATRAEERKATKETNKTVEMLKRIGADPRLVELAQSGYAKDAIGLAYAKPKTGRVVTAEQLRQMFPGASIENGLYNIKDDNTVTKVGGGGTSISLGGSSKDKYFEEEAGDLAKQMTGVRSAGAVAAANINTLRTMRDLYEVSPSGAIVGRFAEMFPEMSDASAVLQSLRTNLAPQLRVEGSGSTSDIEYEGMLKSLGSLRNSPEANKAIIDAMLAKMELNAAKAKIAAQVRPNGLDPYDALQQMQALEEQMWVQNPALSLARSLGKGAPIATGSTPVVINGVTIQKVE